KTDLFKDDCPRIEEDRLDVEDDKNERENVVADVKPHLASADGDLAAFVRSQLLRVGIMRPQEPADQERDGDKQRADSEKNSDTGVLLEHAAASSSLRRPGRQKAVGSSHHP